MQEAREAVRTVRLVPSRSNEEEQTPRRRKRNSDSASDSGFESDLDSVFSAGTGGGMETPATAPSIASNHAWTSRQHTGKDAIVSRAGNRAGQRMGEESAAWATVEALRGENQDLRTQMEEMQRTLQGCIDLVGSIHGV